MSDLILNNGITEAEFRRVFPLPYNVVALSPWEAMRAGKNDYMDTTYWRYVTPFQFVSDRFDATIEAPAGTITDFASVPHVFRNLVDDDCPQILYASSPHDELFRCLGKLPCGKVLTFEMCNRVLIDGMWKCGANKIQRFEVYEAVMTVGKHIWNEYARRSDPSRIV
jgi:hypothetical protein